MSYSHDLQQAISIARDAGKLVMRYFTQETPAFEKKDLSPVTVADQESEAFISRALAEAFPDDGILGEEGACRPSLSGRRWLIDPIDGTRDFVRRNPFWSIQIALQEKGTVVAGLIYFPCLDEICHAALGEGCYFNRVRCAASNIASIDKGILMISGFSSVWGTWPAEAVQFLTEKCWTVRCYGGCYDVAMIARGKADIWLAGNGMEWDYAPARIIARECGARFFAQDGTDRIDARNCVMCVPGVESQLRSILRIPGAP